MLNFMRLRQTIIYFIIIVSAVCANAQNITISGVIRDSISHKPVPYATILLLGTDRGELTGENGKFSIATALYCNKVRVAAKH